VHWPIAERALPGARLLGLVADTAAAAVARGLHVLLHYEEGRNRSGLVTALLLCRLTGCSGAEAMARVRAARPGMLSNRTFAAYLADLPATTTSTG
jgi:ADP-ribosyl-[dinitrogen reductase] hydrolase